MCKTNECRECGGKAKPSKGYGKKSISFDDFGGDAGDIGTTQTEVTGDLIDCLKCKDCGHSWVPVEDRQV
jgi:hypothetical protein